MTTLAAAVASGSSSSTLSQVEPGALGFLVVAGMGIVLFFLLKNMNKQFKKLGPPPEEADVKSAAGESKAVIATVPSGETVQTGDPKQDARAQGVAERK